MSRQALNVGTGPDAGDGDTPFEYGPKIEANFVELYGLVLADAFTVSVSPASPILETGATATTPGFAATYSVTPETAVLTDSAGTTPENIISSPTSFASDANFTRTANNATVTFTVTATASGVEKTGSADITWRPRAYWGVGSAGGNTEAFIEALASSGLQSSRAKTFTVNAGSGQKIYYAYPTSYGAATFTVGGFEGGFALVSTTISVTNANGVTQNYTLYESDQLALGSTTVIVS